MLHKHRLIVARVNKPTRGVFTHYTQTNAARFDRMYMMKILATNKISSKTVATALQTLGSSTTDRFEHSSAETWKELMET
jgi:hypothetical protein